MDGEDHLVQPRLSRGLLAGEMLPDGELTWPDKERYLALLRFCLELFLSILLKSFHYFLSKLPSAFLILPLKGSVSVSLSKIT